MKTRISSFIAFLLSGITAAYGHGMPVKEGDDHLDSKSQLIEYSNPEFTQQALYPSSESKVLETAQYDDADVVLLDGGSSRGFRTGMLCDVSNDDGIFARIILVDVKQDRSAGLIVEFVNDDSIKFGNLVRVKTVRY